MELENERQVANTRAKLRELQDRYDAAMRELPPDDRVRRTSLQSIKRMINQLKEELTRYEARTFAKGRDSATSEPLLGIYAPATRSSAGIWSKWSRTKSCIV